MLPYWLLFTLAATFALVSRGMYLSTDHRFRYRMPNSGAWVFLWLAVSAFVGFRHEVGADWVQYEGILRLAIGVDFYNAPGSDPAYALLNWIGANYVGGVYFVNFASALVFIWGIIKFSRAQPRPWLAFFIAVPYLITVVGMGYTRQAVAIGLVMWGLSMLMKERVRYFLLFVGIAALFHKSAVIIIPLALFAGSKTRFTVVLGALVTSVLMYYLFLYESLDYLVANYIDREYQSTGAAVRVALNALPAFVFLTFKKRFGLTLGQQKLWTWISVASLMFIVLLFATSSSTAIDRVALYLIPLQIFVWSRVPDALGRVGASNLPWILLVIFYHFLIYFVWLNFGRLSSAWLPYQFYPWLWISS